MNPDQQQAIHDAFDALDNPDSRVIVRPTGKHGTRFTIVLHNVEWNFVRHSDADEWHMDYRATNGRPDYHNYRCEVPWDSPEHHTLDNLEEPFICGYCLQVPRHGDDLDPQTGVCGRCEDEHAGEHLDAYLAAQEDHRPTAPGNGWQYREGWKP